MQPVGIILGYLAEATTEALKEEGSEKECQRRVTCRRVRIVAAAAPDDRERTALRRGQLARTVWSIRQESLKVIPCGRTARPGKRKSPDIARIDNAVHKVQCHLRAKMIVAHVGRQAPEIARTHCVRSVISSCVRELVEVLRVLEF
jgi:hypothetical protein